MPWDGGFLYLRSRPAGRLSGLAVCLAPGRLRRAELPRAHFVNVHQGCPQCGTAIFSHGGFYPWKPEHRPCNFRSECPGCGAVFPNNDLAGGDYVGGDFVDDGYGYFDEEGHICLFAATHHRDQARSFGAAIDLLTRHLRRDGVFGVGEAPPDSSAGALSGGDGALHRGGGDLRQQGLFLPVGIDGAFVDTHQGDMRFKDKVFCVTSALRLLPVGLEETDHGIWSINLTNVLIGKIDEREMILRG